MKYLIIDDTKITRQIAKDIMLEAIKGALVTETASGEEGLQALEADNYDVVLLDIIMPGIDGIETLKEIMKNEYPVKVIMYSSVSELDALEECFALGAVDFIHKPLIRTDFIARVKSVSRQKQLEDETKKHLKQIKAQQKELLNTQIELLRQEKMASIGQLSSGVVHELQEPLRYISSNLFKINDYFESNDLYQGEGANFEDLVLESNQKLRKIQDIVSSLSNFSETDSNDLVKEYNINRGIRDIVTITQNKAKEVANVKVDYGKVPIIDGMTSELNQAFFNFYVNTLETIRLASLEELSEITIRTDADNEFVHVSILEDGIGPNSFMLSGMVDKTIEIEDCHQALKMSYNTIVKRHGGKITVTPEEKGVIFDFYLPINQE